MPRRPQTYTLAEVERRQQRAITGARNLGLDDSADSIEEMTAGEFAEYKNLVIENPTNRVGERRKRMATKSRAQLLEENETLQEQVDALTEKLDAINAITTEPDIEPDVDDDEDDEE